MTSYMSKKLVRELSIQTATVIINRRALQYNFQRLCELAPESKFIAIVKANAYGHGLLEVARALPNANAFGVAHLEEALHLRNGNIIQPIFLLEGFLSIRDLDIISNHQFQAVIHSMEQLEILETAKLKEPITVWMKLDTGMHRLGVRLEKAEEFYKRLMCCKNIRQPVNIISHFSRANELKCGITEQQLSIFNSFCKGKPGLRSIAASSGILLWPQSHFDWVRPGIILYGVSPLEQKPWGEDFGFQPVMSLVSILIAIRDHKAGEPVGYGGTWTSKYDTRLGIIAIGYGDGYPCAMSPGALVLLNNREVSIVGRVAMDVICVDLGPQAKDRIGDLAILWGEGLPIEYIAQLTGISSYELITSLTSRVAVRYLD